MGFLLDGVDSFCRAVSNTAVDAVDRGVDAAAVDAAIQVADPGLARSQDSIFQNIEVAVGDLGAAADVASHILTDLGVTAMSWSWMRAEDAAPCGTVDLFVVIDRAEQILHALDGHSVHAIPSGWRDEWQAVAQAVAARRGPADRAALSVLGPRSYAGIAACCRLLGARFPRPGLLGLASLVAELSDALAREGALVARQRLRGLLQPIDVADEHRHRFGLEQVRAAAREVECGMVELPQYLHTMVRLHAEMPSSGRLPDPEPSPCRGASMTVLRAQMAALAKQVRERAAAGWMPPVAVPRAVPAARPMESHRRQVCEQGRQFWWRIRQLAAGLLELHLAVTALQTVFASPGQPAPEEAAPPAGAELGLV